MSEPTIEQFLVRCDKAAAKGGIAFGNREWLDIVRPALLRAQRIDAATDDEAIQSAVKWLMSHLDHLAHYAPSDTAPCIAIILAQTDRLTERLAEAEAALRVAAGIISGHPPWTSTHPEAVYDQLLAAAEADTQGAAQ